MKNERVRNSRTYCTRTTSRSSTCVSRGLALLMSTFTQVIGARMHDDSSLSRNEMISNVAFLSRRERKGNRKVSKGYTHAQNTLGPYQFDLLVGNATFCIALRVGFEVAKIAYMTLTIGGSTVRFGKGVDYMREGGGR